MRGGGLRVGAGRIGVIALGGLFVSVGISSLFVQGSPRDVQRRLFPFRSPSSGREM